MHSFKTTAELVTYLRDTLIPDLRDSGSDATADDFEDALEVITEMQKQVLRAAWALQDVVTDFDGMQPATAKGVIAEVYGDLFAMSRQP